MYVVTTRRNRLDYSEFDTTLSRTEKESWSLESRNSRRWKWFSNTILHNQYTVIRSPWLSIFSASFRCL